MALTARLVCFLLIGYVCGDQVDLNNLFRQDNIPRTLHFKVYKGKAGKGLLASHGLKTNQVELTYKLVSPSACQAFESLFGCCWDNVTIATGPKGNGCPKCLDSKESCANWKDSCHEAFVATKCPQTCEKCGHKNGGCLDNADDVKYCALYKHMGLCRRRQIRRHCRNTCDACNEL